MITIKSFNCISNNGLMPILIRALQEFEDEGIAEDQPTLHWNQKAIAAYDDDKIVGIMTYDYLDYSNSIFIQISYVDKYYRKKGIYSKLWQEIKINALAKGCVFISSIVHVNNYTMQQVCNNLGREQKGIVYTYKLMETPAIKASAPVDKDDEIPF